MADSKTPKSHLLCQTAGACNRRRVHTPEEAKTTGNKDKLKISIKDLNVDPILYQLWKGQPGGVLSIKELFNVKRMYPPCKYFSIENVWFYSAVVCT